MPLRFEELLKLFEYNTAKVEEENKKNETYCEHDFIPLFNTVCCKYCGIDKDKIKED